MLLRWCFQWRHVLVSLAMVVVASQADDPEQRFAHQVNDVARERSDHRRITSGEQSGSPNSVRGLEEFHRESKTTQGKEGETKHEGASKVGDRFGRSVEEEFTESDVVCGINLLGFVVFIMTLYYLVHWPDKDMVVYVWTVISTTISIFLAIFAFSSVKLIVEACFVEYEHAAKFALLGFAQLVTWFSVMQVSVAYVSGVMDEQPFKPEGVMKIQDQKMARRISFKSVATLLAHCTGFAAINFGGCLQHMFPFNSSWVTRFLVIPLMYVLNVLAETLVRIIRVKIKSRILVSMKRAGDSYESLELKRDETGIDQEQTILTETEEHLEWCLETWDEESYEAELDVAGLSISFLLVQSVRASLTGVMPNNLGIEPGVGVHPQSCSIYMILFGLAFAGICVSQVIIHEWYFPLNKKVAPLSCESGLLRVVRIMQISSAMAFSWSLFVASKWEIARYLPQYQANGVISRVILTVELSFIAFWVIVALDKLADAEWTGDTTDRAIITIIGALSTLVGFAYEQAFDGAVEALAATSFKWHPLLGELLLTVGVWIIVYPAWRKYILRKLLVLKEQRILQEDGGRLASRSKASLSDRALESAAMT